MVSHSAAIGLGGVTTLLSSLCRTHKIFNAVPKPQGQPCCRGSRRGQLQVAVTPGLAADVDCTCGVLSGKCLGADFHFSSFLQDVWSSGNPKPSASQDLLALSKHFVPDKKADLS